MGVLLPKSNPKNVSKFTLYTPWKMGQEQPKRWKYSRPPNSCSRDYTARTVAKNKVVEISHCCDYGSVVVMIALR